MPTKDEWLARLTFERDELLASVDGISQMGWATGEVLPGWTARDVLAHIAAWETRVADELPRLLADGGMEIIGVEADAFNAEQVGLRKERSPRELVDELAASRQRIEQTLATATDDDLAKPRAVPWGLATIESWALQEIYEHDGLHAAQLRAWRAAHPESGRALQDTLLDQIAAERAGLFIACIGLNDETLSTAPVMGEWSIKDTLAHVAAWDDTHAERTRLALAGREAEIAAVEVDERNAELYAQRRGWLFELALQAAIDARQRYIDVLSEATDAQLVRPLALPWQEASVWEFARRRARHDGVHAGHIRAWRAAASPLFSPGPRLLLLMALEAARHDLSRQINRVPSDERDTRPAVGEWTTRDLVGHVADWDRFSLGVLRAVRESRPLPYVAESEADAINARQVAARRGQSWEQVWADFQHSRADLVDALADWNEAQLAQEIDYPFWWGRTVYGWVAVQIWHDREHADALRAANI